MNDERDVRASSQGVAGIFARGARTAGLVLLLAIASCASSTESKGPSLHGNWIYVTDDGTAGMGLTFEPDNSYVFVNMQLTSMTTAKAEVETGVYAVNGAAITFTPQQWTCPGPDPVTTFNHSFNSGGNLVFSLPSGVISLKPNNAPATEAFVVVYGCFDRKTGAFKRADLAPVEN